MKNHYLQVKTIKDCACKHLKALLTKGHGSHLTCESSLHTKQFKDANAKYLSCPLSF